MKCCLKTEHLMLHRQRAYISHRVSWECYDKTLFVFLYKSFCTVLALYVDTFILISGVPRNFVRGRQQIHLRTEDRENGDLGAVAP